MDTLYYRDGLETVRKLCLYVSFVILFK